jgi:hypothetical protein
MPRKRTVTLCGLRIRAGAIGACFFSDAAMSFAALSKTSMSPNSVNKMSGLRIDGAAGGQKETILSI